MTVQSVEEVLASSPSLDNTDGVSVAHLSRWTRRNKITGEEKSFSTLTIADVRVREGKRVLVEVTEIIC